MQSTNDAATMKLAEPELYNEPAASGDTFADPETAHKAVSTDSSDAAHDDDCKVSDTNESLEDDDSVDELCLISNLKGGGKNYYTNNQLDHPDGHTGDQDEPVVDLTNSFRRYNEYQSFLTRSQRAVDLPDKPPTSDELSRRKVHFVTADDDDDNNNEGSELLNSKAYKVHAKVYQVDPIPDEYRDDYFMTNSDFSRIDRDAELTIFRWNNHKNGKIRFDATNNTLRGMESVFDKSYDRFGIMGEHQRKVLTEIHNQKIAHKKMDWERVRQVSLDFSAELREKALEMGQFDEEECERIWKDGYDPMADEGEFVLGGKQSDSAAPGKPKKHKKWSKAMRVLSFGKKG